MYNDRNLPQQGTKNKREIYCGWSFCCKVNLWSIFVAQNEKHYFLNDGYESLLLKYQF